LNEDEETGMLIDVFARIGKAGGCASSQSEAVGRLASMALRAGMAPEEVIEQLRSISCHTPAWSPKGKVMSCADAISKALEWYLENKQIEAKPKKKTEFHRGACPNCGGALMYMEGCAKCVCGYSDCG
jgi:ribonucleoside-diphosphate reductase alpha chain